MTTDKADLLALAQRICAVKDDWHTIAVMTSTRDIAALAEGVVELTRERDDLFREGVRAKAELIDARAERIAAEARLAEVERERGDWKRAAHGQRFSHDVATRERAENAEAERDALRGRVERMAATIEAARGVVDIFSLGPLELAAKFGPDVNPREMEDARLTKLNDALDALTPSPEETTTES